MKKKLLIGLLAFSLAAQNQTQAISIPNFVGKPVGAIASFTSGAFHALWSNLNWNQRSVVSVLAFLTCYGIRNIYSSYKKPKSEVDSEPKKNNKDEAKPIVNSESKTAGSTATTATTAKINNYSEDVAKIRPEQQQKPKDNEPDNAKGCISQ